MCSKGELIRGSHSFSYDCLYMMNHNIKLSSSQVSKVFKARGQKELKLPKDKPCSKISLFSVQICEDPSPLQTVLAAVPILLYSQMISFHYLNKHPK